MSLLDSLNGVIGGSNSQVMGFVTSVQSFIEQSGGIEFVRQKLTPHTHGREPFELCQRFTGIIGRAYAFTDEG